MKIILVFAFLVILCRLTTDAQDFVSPTTAVESGKAPAAKVKLLSSNGNTRTYVIVFSPGDEVRSGLNDFAKNFNVTSAHYSAIGDVFRRKSVSLTTKEKCLE